MSARCSVAWLITLMYVAWDEMREPIANSLDELEECMAYKTDDCVHAKKSRDERL